MSKEEKRVPELRFKGYVEEWEQRKLRDLIEQVIREVPKPDTPYERLSVRSHAKGTFHQYVDDPSAVAMDKLYIVRKNDLIVNITFAWEHAIAVTKEIDDGLLVSHRFPTYRADGKSDIDFLHYMVSQEEFRRKLELISPGGAGRNRVLNKKDFMKIEVVVPKSIEEQTKIGVFFNEFDNTIALHQRKLIKLCLLKKYFLQKMFLKMDQSKPLFRFANFRNDWEQRKLDSMVDRVKSYSLSREVETSEYTGYKYIHYGDIHTKVADVIDESSNLPNIKSGNYELLEKGDLVLADASEDYQGIATPAIIIVDTPYKLVSGLHTIALRPKQVDSMFLYYLFNSPSFRKYGYKTGTGMKVFGISVTNLLKFESKLPSIDEQIMIGNILLKLDNSIALYQRRIDNLNLLKEAYLEKMFI